MARGKPGLPAARRVELAYAGARNHGGRLLHAYQPAAAGERALLFEKPLCSYPVGSVVAYRSPDGRAVVPGAELYRGVHPDPDVVAQWQHEHEAVMMSAQAWADDSVPDSLEVLKPVRAAYRALGAEERALLLMHVVRYIVEE